MAYIHTIKKYDPENFFPATDKRTSGSCVSVWFNGCSKACEGCFNPLTWDRRPNLYIPNKKVAETVLGALDRHFPKSLALLGGDPLEHSFTGDKEHWNNIDDTIEILSQVKEVRPHTQVICWTGYTWQECIRDDKVLSALQLIDVLVDGRFNLRLKVDNNNRLYGSSNQRVIDVQASLLMPDKKPLPVPNC